MSRHLLPRLGDYSGAGAGAGAGLGRFLGSYLGDLGDVTDPSLTTDPYGNVDYVDPTRSPDVYVTAPPPPTLTLSTTPFGPAPMPSLPYLPVVTPPAPTTPFSSGTPTGVPQAVAFRNPDGSATYDGHPYSATDLLNPYNVAHFFGGFLTPTNATNQPRLNFASGTYGVTAPAQASLFGGMSTPTLALLAAGIVGAVVLAKKK